MRREHRRLARRRHQLREVVRGRPGHVGPDGRAGCRPPGRAAARAPFLGARHAIAVDGRAPPSGRAASRSAPYRPSCASRTRASAPAVSSRVDRSPPAENRRPGRGCLVSAADATRRDRRGDSRRVRRRAPWSARPRAREAAGPLRFRDGHRHTARTRSSCHAAGGSGQSSSQLDGAWQVFHHEKTKRRRPLDSKADPKRSRPGGIVSFMRKEKKETNYCRASSITTKNRQSLRNTAYVTVIDSSTHHDPFAVRVSKTTRSFRASRRQRLSSSRHHRVAGFRFFRRLETPPPRLTLASESCRVMNLRVAAPEPLFVCTARNSGCRATKTPACTSPVRRGPSGSDARTRVAVSHSASASRPRKTGLELFVVRKRPGVVLRVHDHAPPRGARPVPLRNQPVLESGVPTLVSTCFAEMRVRRWRRRERRGDACTCGVQASAVPRAFWADARTV